MEFLKKASTSAEQNSSEARKIVEGILADIRANGEDAVRVIAKKFDKWDQEFVLSPEKKSRLIASVPEKTKQDIQFAYEQITAFAKAQRDSIKDFEMVTPAGVRAGQRVIPMDVAAGAVAKQLLLQHKIEVCAYTVALGGIHVQQRDLSLIQHNSYYCPDAEAAVKMEQRVQEVRSQGDTVGGIVEIVACCPAGLGEPVFDKLEAELAHGLMSIGAVKGVEIGAGFTVAEMLGSENNDPIGPSGFLSNNAGGILAGISSGAPLVIRVAVKPIPSISKEQQTVNLANEPVTIKVGGRHDISAIPRIIPVCEAMVRLTLADHLLRQMAVDCQEG